MKDSLFAELLESVEQMDEIVKGEREPAKERFVAASRLKLIRKKVNLSQPKFAMLIGVELSTLRNWEQGRREPTGPAKVLIKAIERDPENVIKACISS
ncbi:MAG: helix-turn-helix domain-containing protein [Idiomarina sp.]|nr:helix-turn-helix domain-containing protein [Idiomarina sp.]